MNRTTSALAAAIGIAFLSVATPAMAAPDNGPEFGTTVPTATRCIGNGPLYDHPEEYLPLCPTTDLITYPSPVEPAVQPTTDPSPTLVTTGALGGLALAALGLTGALVLRRRRLQVAG